MENTSNVRSLLQALLLLQNEDEAGRFLRDLLTEEEIREFSRRWEVAQLLAEKVSYVNIEKKTQMSSTTIARISKFLSGKFGGYQLVLDRLHHHSNSVSPVGSDA
jgi:TrpR-related protein YerC/YecD